MKRLAWIGLGVVALALGVAGCSWETGGDATSWSSDYNWVNFSGLYRSAAGGLLVTDYTTTPSTPGSTNVLSVTKEAQGSYAALQTTFSGKLKNGNIVPGSANLAFGAWDSAQDDGNRMLVGSLGQGTIDYVSGTWTYKTSSSLVAPTAGGDIKASYSYKVSNSGTGGGARPGSTGYIYTFSVVQQGEHLTLTDNNGAAYTGYIGEFRSASGTERTDEADKFMPVDGDTIIASFQCSGTSRAGVQVKIVGSFQGTVASGVFTGRTLTGTWIEAGGKSGDINGQTTSVTISAPTDTGTGTGTGTGTDTNATATGTGTGA